MSPCSAPNSKASRRVRAAAPRASRRRSRGPVGAVAASVPRMPTRACGARQGRCRASSQPVLATGAGAFARAPISTGQHRTGTCTFRAGASGRNARTCGLLRLGNRRFESCRGYPLALAREWVVPARFGDVARRRFAAARSTGESCRAYFSACVLGLRPRAASIGKSRPGTPSLAAIRRFAIVRRTGRERPGEATIGPWFTCTVLTRTRRQRPCAARMTWRWYCLRVCSLRPSAAS